MISSRALIIAAFLAAPVVVQAQLNEVQAQQNELIVFFPFDSDRLTEAGEMVIEAAAEEYRQTGATAISLVGHTDTVGSDEYNLDLSRRRAAAATEALIERGVPGAAITAAWRGEEDPLVQTGEGVREQLNRRVEIAVAEPAAPAVMPEPMAETLRRVAIGIGPYLGINEQEGDNSVFIGGNLTLSYAVTPNIALSGEQAVFYNDDAEDEGWGGRSAIGADYYAFGFDGDGVIPHIGVNGGYMYIDGSGTGGWFGGPEAGLSWGPFEAKAAYDFVESRSAEEGVISLTLGYNLKF